MKQEKIGKMKEIKMEKVVLSISSVGEDLDKGAKLLERITGRKAARKKSKKRIPSLGVRPGLEVGCVISLRGKKAEEILRKLLGAVDNRIREKQISENSFTFGIKEYIQIPGIQYQRDVGILGFDVSVAFSRHGKRVVKRKIKRGRLPKKQRVSKQEIINFLEKNFEIEVI
jgi:large subunit ribosomal protein L5